MADVPSASTHNLGGTMKEGGIMELRALLGPVVAVQPDQFIRNYIDNYEAGLVKHVYSPRFCPASSFLNTAIVPPENRLIAQVRVKPLGTVIDVALRATDILHTNGPRAGDVVKDVIYDLCLETLGERRPVWYQKPWVAKVISLVVLVAGVHLGMRFVDLFLNGWAVVFAMFPVGFALGYNSSRIERWIKRKLGTRDRKVAYGITRCARPL